MYPAPQTGTVTCPHCQTPLMVAPGMAGQMVACARCGRPLMMPHLGGAPGMQPMPGTMPGQMPGTMPGGMRGPVGPQGGAGAQPQPGGKGGPHEGRERPVRGAKSDGSELIGYYIFGGLLGLIILITLLGFFFGLGEREKQTEQRKFQTHKTEVQIDIFDQARTDLGTRQIDKVVFDSKKAITNGNGNLELSGRGESNNRPVTFTIEYRVTHGDRGTTWQVRACKIRPAG